MTRRLSELAAILVLAATGLSAQADEVTNVINKAIKANGGKDALTKYKAATMKGSGTVNVMGMEIKYSATWYYLYPSLYRVDLEGEAGGMTFKVVQVSDGKEGWQKIGDMETMKLPKNDFDNVKSQIAIQEITTLLPLLDKKRYTVASLGDVKVKGKKAIGLNVTSKGGVDVNLYFDPTTLMIIKLQHQAKDPTGKEVTQTLFMNSFKKIQGVAFPTKVQVDQDGKKFVTVEFSEIKVSEKLDASVFKKP
jgi:outer membrane lipoprotein-sorting protein